MGIAGKSGQKITPVVCDTGPVLHLMEAGLLHLLKEAGKIYIPNSVEAELVGISPQWGKEKPKWITIEVALYRVHLEQLVMRSQVVLLPWIAFSTFAMSLFHVPKFGLLPS